MTDWPLRRKEKLLWTGRPGPMPLWRRRERPMSIGGLGTVLFALLVTWHLVGARDFPAVGLLLPVMWALFPLHLAIVHPLLVRRIRANTVYGVTTERVLVLESWPRRRLSEWNLSHLHRISIEAEGRGVLSVVFGWRPSASNRD